MLHESKDVSHSHSELQFIFVDINSVFTPLLVLVVLHTFKEVSTTHYIFQKSSSRYENDTSVSKSPTSFFLQCFIQSRPINLSQRASPAAFTVTKRCAMAHQTPHPLTRCCGAQTKVLSVDTETARDIPRQKPLTLLEGKMVSCDVVVLAVDAILCLILNGCYKENAAS